MTDTSILCVKWGNKFNADYVNRLHKMVQRNLTLPFHFYCLTEDSSGLDPGIHVLPFPDSGLEYCWNKLLLFADGLGGLSGEALFFDLDVVITDNIDCLLEYRPEASFSGIFDWNRPSNPQFNAPMMRFTVGKHSHVLESLQSKVERNELVKKREWDAYLGAHEKVVYWAGGERFGSDQAWTSKQLFPAAEIRANSYPASWLLSYKAHGIEHLPQGCKVMVFHGFPKPHEVRNAYVLEHWK